MKNSTSLVLCLLCFTKLFSQNIGIGTNNPGATLELFDTASSTIGKTFLVRSNYTAYPRPALDTVFQVSNNGNVGIGAGQSTGLLDIFGRFGDSVLLNLHGSPTPIFGADAVLRFSGNAVNYFDIAARFPENIMDRSISIGKLSVNRFGAVIIGGQPYYGSNSNSFTINHNAASDPGLPFMLTEYASETPVRINLSNFSAGGYTNWTMSAYSTNNADSSFIKFQHYTGLPFNRFIQFTGAGKIGVNATAIATQTQVQINGKDNPGNTPLVLNGVQEYDDNAEAIAAGLPGGAVYRTGDLLKIVH